jgi:hypothetical protein
MDSVRVQALLIAGFVGVTLAAISVAMIVNWSRATRGGLARNPYFGVRTPSTLRSEQSWVAGNRAAVRTAPLYLLFNAAICAALLVAALHGWRLVVAFIGGGGFFTLIGLMICTAVIASRAARAVGDDTDGRGAVSQSFEMPALDTRFSARTITIISWTCAVAACAVTVFLLGTIIDGYMLAIHRQLQPNPTFGFRSETAFSCLPRWYAAQKAGFSWVLFSYGPVVVASLLMCLGAAIQRRSPWDICALVLGSAFLAIFFVVVAGIHADSVARAVPC